MSDPSYKSGQGCAGRLGSPNPKRHDVHPIEQIAEHLAYPKAVVKHKDRLYIARSNQRFSVVDLSDPKALRRLGGFELPYEVHSLLVRDQTAVLFVKDRANKGQESTTLITVDLQDPTHPKERSRQKRLGRLSAIQERGDSVFVKFIEHEGCTDCKKTRGQRVVQLDWSSGLGLVQSQEWFVPLKPTMHAQEGLTLSDSHLALVSTTSPTQALRSQVHLIRLAPSGSDKPSPQTLEFEGWIQESWQTRFQKGHLLVSAFTPASSRSGGERSDDADEREPGDPPPDLRKGCERVVLRSFDLSQPGSPREVYSKTLDNARFSRGEWSPRIEFGSDKGLVFWPESARIQVLDLQKPESPQLSKRLNVQAQGDWVQECVMRGNEALLFGYDRPYPPKHLDDGHFVAKLVDLSDPMQPKIADQLRFGSYKLRHSAHRHRWFPSLWRHEDLVFANVGYNDDTFAPADPYCDPDNRAKVQLLQWTPGKLSLHGQTAMPGAERHQLVHGGSLVNYNGERLTRVNLNDLSAPLVEQDLLLDRSRDAIHSFDEEHWLVSHHDTWRNELVIQLLSKDPARSAEVLAQHVIPGSPKAQCMRSPHVVDVFVRDQHVHLWVEGFEDSGRALPATLDKTIPQTHSTNQFRAAPTERAEAVVSLKPQARLISIAFRNRARPQQTSSIAVPAVRTPLGATLPAGTLRGHTLGRSDLIRLGDSLLVKERTRENKGQIYVQDWQIDLRPPTPELRPLSERHALRLAGGFTKADAQQAWGWEAYPDGDSESRELRVQMQRYRLDERGEIARDTQGVSGIPIGFSLAATHTSLVTYRYESFKTGEPDHGTGRKYVDPEDPTKSYRLISELLSSNLAYGSLKLDETITRASRKHSTPSAFASLGSTSLVASWNFDRQANRGFGSFEIWRPSTATFDSINLFAIPERVVRLDPQSFLVEYPYLESKLPLSVIDLRNWHRPRLTHYRIPEGTRCNTPKLVGNTLVCATGSSGLVRFNPLAKRNIPRAATFNLPLGRRPGDLDIP